MNIINQPEIFILIRQSPDWKNISYPDFIKQSEEFCTAIGRPKDLVKKTVDLWNETFGISFFTVRQKLKEITIKNLNCVKKSYLLENLESIESLDINKNGILIPIDDDDWICPDICDYFNIDETSINGFVWGHIVVGSVGIQYRKLDDFCYTNNYAVTLAYLRKYKIDKIYQHFSANRNIQKSEKININSYLSATNKHPCSTLVLEQSLKQEFSNKSLVSAVSKYNQKLNQLSDESIKLQIPWAYSQIIELRTIFNQVLNSQKI